MKGCQSAGDGPAVDAGPGRRLRRVALAGNPNVGKSSLFNRLTGLHQKVTNYPGVTVERKSGRADTPGGPVEIVDLPGSYSLSPHTVDEAVVRDEIRGLAGAPAPDMLVLVLDASNLARNLFFALQLLDAGIPAVAALNCCDAAASEGITVDGKALGRLLGIPVVPTCGRTGEGVEALRAAIAAGGAVGTPPAPSWVPEVEGVAALLAAPLADRFGGVAGARRRRPALRGAAGRVQAHAPPPPRGQAGRGRRERNALAARGVDAATATAEARYRMVDAVVAEVVHAPLGTLSWRERLDRVLTHRVSGTLVLVGLFTLMFQALFAWSGPLMDGVGALFGLLGEGVSAVVPGGLVRDFLVNGILAGFAGVVVFVPQIVILFLLIELMDDSGYLARAAFLLDRLMGKAGLPGRAFLPLVSGFACAIPGVMATRTIKDPRDRLATMFTVPFMSCSARLPVYTMIIGALFSEGKVLGLLATGTVVMISMYLLGIVAGLLSAGLLRRTLLKGGKSPLLLELPGYRWPQPRSVLLEVGRRTWQFVSRAGPVIVVLTVVLWVLSAFPRDVPLERDYDALRAEARAAAGAAADAPAESLPPGVAAALARLDSLEGAERSAGSYAGRIGKTMEPVLRPLGFDWKIGIGIVASFAAREVFVSTLAVVYAAGDAGVDDRRLLEKIRTDVDPETGRPVFRPLVGISLLVFFVLAMQCMSTLAVVRRETGGWKWPMIMLGWMTALAYLASLLVYQVGSAMGW